MSPVVVRTYNYVGNPFSFLKRNQIDLILDKYSFKPGDTITGKINLKLKKPMMARKISVALVGIRIIRMTGMSVGPVRVGSSKQNQDQIYNIYNFEIPLDGENMYFNELYPFEIKIPVDILQSAQQVQPPAGLGGGLTEFVLTMQQSFLAANSRVEWSVETKLDIPRGTDIRKSQQIVIS